VLVLSIVDPENLLFLGGGLLEEGIEIRFLLEKVAFVARVEDRDFYFAHIFLRVTVIDLKFVRVPEPIVNILDFQINIQLLRLGFLHLDEIFNHPGRVGRLACEDTLRLSESRGLFGHGFDYSVGSRAERDMNHVQMLQVRLSVFPFMDAEDILPFTRAEANVSALLSCSCWYIS